MSPAPAGARPHGFLGGVAFLTRIPVGASIGERDVAASVAWFPVVGALIGAACGVVFFGADRLWPPIVAAIVAIGVGVLVTGAFHEDGLGDTADAFGAASTGRDPQDALKDPRLGTYGVAALVLAIGLRVACVAALTPRAGALALIGAHSLARGVSAATAVSVRGATPGLGSSVASLATPRRGVVGLIIGGIVATVCLGLGGPTALAAAGLSAIILARWATRSLGGVNGDVLGAVEQIGEVSTLLVAVAVSRGVGLPFA